MSLSAKAIGQRIQMQDQLEPHLPVGQEVFKNRFLPIKKTDLAAQDAIQSWTAFERTKL